jgi:hypothetical protein
MVGVNRGRNKNRGTDSGAVTHTGHTDHVASAGPLGSAGPFGSAGPLGSGAPSGHADPSGSAGLLAPSGRRLFTGVDGRLTAYAGSAAGPVRWTESPRGGFEGPTVFEVPGWVGPSGIAVGSEGYVYVAGLRHAPEGGTPHVILSTQYQTGRPLGDWRDLGAPTTTAGPAADATAGPPAGAGDAIVAGPVVVVNQVSGSVHVLVSLRYGGIVRRSRTGEGRWGRWKNVTDQPYTGEFTAQMPTGGALQVLAVNAAGALDRWVLVKGGGAELRDRFAMAVTDGTGTALETGRKRATYIWRYPGDDSLVAWRAQGKDTPGGVMALGGAGGRGRPGVGRGVIGGYDCTVLAQVGAHGGIEVTAYVTENEGYGTWWAPLADTGRGGGAGDAPRDPQVGTDGQGRLVVAAFDRAGGLLLARQDRTQDGLAFGPWHRESGHARSAAARQW